METQDEKIRHDSFRRVHVTHLEIPSEADGDEEYIDALKTVDHVKDPLPGDGRNVL